MELLWQGSDESHASIPARVSLATPAPASPYTFPSSLQSRPRLSLSLSHTSQRLGEFSEPCVHSIQILMEDALALNPLSAPAFNLPYKHRRSPFGERVSQHPTQSLSALSKKTRMKMEDQTWMCLGRYHLNPTITQGVQHPLRNQL